MSGYITSVPVTDNQHVKAGDVIARIDDLDYRTALEQTEAQLAAAQANIGNIDAQLDVQQAQINANQAQVDQPQAARVFVQQQAVRYDTSSKRVMAPFRTLSNIPRSPTSSRLRLRARRQP